MTDRPEDATPPTMTPEQKKAAERRLAPLMQTLVDVSKLKLAVMEALVEAGPGGFDPQAMHLALTTQFEEARRRFENDLGRVKRMLAVEALRAEGQVLADGDVRLHAVDKKMAVMDGVTRALQREAREQARQPARDTDEPSEDLPRPR